MNKSDEYYCPNSDCKKEKLADGEKECPECGAWAQKVEATKLARLLQQKKACATRATTVKREDKEILFSDEMTDEQIRMLISRDMLNLAMHEAGTAWMKLGTLLSLKSTDQMIGSGFKALVDQNKILIRQNELIIRGLKKLAEKKGDSLHS